MEFKTLLKSLITQSPLKTTAASPFSLRHSLSPSAAVNITTSRRQRYHRPSLKVRDPQRTTMAEAILDLVLQNINSLIRKELTLFFCMDEDFSRLTSTLTAVKATLQDAAEKQFSNNAIKDWLQKLNDAAHILDDILDGYHYQQQANMVHNSFLSSLNPKHVVFRRKIAKKMKGIRERLDEIAEERIKFHLTEVHTERRTGDMAWRQTTSNLHPQIYGREEDTNKIVEFLVGDASNFDDLSIIPIVGMGGLGKTTLAQLIFNHERVIDHFEQRIWVCVSEDFSLKTMTKAIIETASGHYCEDLNQESLQRSLQELLRNKRYLIVLDDVWDHDQENWEKLKSILSCGAKGASILVTTRLIQVESIMRTTPPHQLSMLSENDCWELFKQRAFGPNEIERIELVIIGKEIVKKCGGVPLAAKALGGLLRFKREEKEWRYVKESKLWSLTQDENSVMPALRLSYLNLPVQLRQCFAFCALFPKDRKMNKNLLIDLSLANGFISSNEILEAEDIGEEVCNELYRGSFFQDIETDKFGKITNFKMHDLVHDLAQSVDEEIFRLEDGVISVPERIRHLSIHKQANSIQLRQVKSLRTCIFQISGQLSLDVYRCYSLRVLHMAGLNNLSPSISRLKCLRYLNLSGFRCKTLPESLCKLLNLQVLNLDHCRSLQKLPKRLKCLKALRHLCLKDCVSLSSVAPEIGELTSLRTLSMYVIGKQRGFLLAELGRLNLKGELHIKHMERVKHVMDAKDANMASKHLTKLVMSWDKKEESQEHENVELILEVLKPSQHLQNLEVEGYTGVQFPEWMGDPSLSELNTVRLKNCKSCLHLSPMGKLLSLKHLRMENMKLVEYMDNETYVAEVAGRYMALESLVLEKLPNLIRLSREVGESMFQSLSELRITDCPKLALPFLPSLKQLTVSGKWNHVLLSSIHKSRSLEYLYFMCNKELTCFPDGMLRDLTSLKTLTIEEYPNLSSLPDWLGNLGLLHSLGIYNCPKLMCLPTSIQCLGALKTLTIVRCSELRKRCEKEIGEDWPKIAHISNIRVYE